MKSFLISILLSAFYLQSFASFAHAETSCQPIYGGGQTCVSTGNILIDKEVLNPETQKMIDNLGINDAKFVPGSTINFQINLTNTGHADIKHIDVKDVFPQFVLFTNGPGKFDVNTKTLSFEVANLKPNETRVFTVVGKIVEANRLPIDLGIVCMVNQATAATSDSGMSQDNAQLCIQKPSQTRQKQVLGAQTPLSKAGLAVLPAPAITTTPATGGELLLIISLIPTGIAGFFLRKKAAKNNHSK
jgi:uncharacterized repeat protein (TIGR01451 family)